ncbi:MAG: ArnT family glycosyltransferase, partial [Planctomycetota bacterium]
RGYLDLLEPLEPHQVAPVLYLWAQLTVVKLLGFHELALRLLAFLCGVASLFWFRNLAGRLLRGTSLLIAVALFSVAYPGIRYAAEAKPYGVDLLVSLVLMTLAVSWWQNPRRTRPLWVLTALLPLALGLSYAAVFVAGGISLVVAYTLWRSGDRRGWTAWVAFNAVLCGCFAALVALAGNQSAAELTWMREYWHLAFPPVSEPLELVWWVVKVHSGRMLGYPVGGAPGTGSLALLCIVVAFVILARRKQWRLFLLSAVPMFLHLVAAALQRYPYGMHAKFTFYLAPVYCLLVGLGGTALLCWLGRARGRAIVLLFVLLGVYTLVASGSIARDLWHPYKTQSDMRARAFAQWFWFNAEFEGEVVCLHSDLGLSFSPQETEDLSWLYTYLSNRRIYSPRHARGEPPRLDRSPLRFVHYRVGYSKFKYDEEAFGKWLDEQKRRYRFVGRERYAFPRYWKGEKTLEVVDHLDVYTFTAK